MKKFRKLLAGLLAGAMMLGSMTATAFAESATQTTTQRTTPATIDTTKTGSLTIHKYEYNYADNEAKITGTGSANDSVPEGARPLSGIKFKITKVADLGSYYGEDSSELPSVETAKAWITSGSFTEEGVTGDVKDVNLGKVTFGDLPLGLYLVQETDSSAQPQITGKVADFLVSIPMTTADGIEWLYDVEVFPKNSSTYAGVTLQKKGKDGSKDSENLQGATFVLQLKGNNNKWTTVTKNNKGIDIGTNGTLTTGTDGKITVSDLAPGEYRFVETGVPSKTGYIMDGTNVKEFGITTDGKVKIGEGTVDTAQNPIEVINEKPEVEKEVKNAAGNWGNASDYSVGDTVPYRVMVDVPKNINKLVNFTLTDTMVNQTYKQDTLKIYSDASFTSEIPSSSYNVDVSSDKKTWSISFNSKDEQGKISSVLEAYGGQKICVSFDTILEEGAVSESTGNPNTVKLEYSNKILPSSNEDGNPNPTGTPSKDEISDQATVYTFKIAVEKVDASDNSKKLEGVKFDLYRKLANTADGEGVLTNPVSGLTGKYERVKHDLTTGEQGVIEVNGLKNGEYYLVETKTIGDYNLLKKPVKVNISAAYTTTTKTTTTTEGEKTTITKEVTSESYSGNEIKTVVKNSKGFTLPTTGGMGTVIFSVLGIALVLAGLLVITASRKKAAK